MDAEPGEARPRELADGEVTGAREAAAYDRSARRFARACAAGDVAALRATLTSDAVAVADGGGQVWAAPHPLRAADGVARLAATLMRPTADGGLKVESVNGRAGVVLRRGREAVAVVAFALIGRAIAAVWIVANPDNLRAWPPQ